MTDGLGAVEPIRSTRADDADGLREAVLEIVGPVLEESPEVDEDGDVLIWIADVLTYASIDADGGAVELTTYLVENVSGPTRAARVLDDSNREFPGVDLVLHGDRVIAEQWVAADPLEPARLVQAVANLKPLVGQVDVLAARLGGRACVFAAESEQSFGENLLADGCGCGDCDCS